MTSIFSLTNNVIQSLLRLHRQARVCMVKDEKQNVVKNHSSPIFIDD